MNPKILAIAIVAVVVVAGVCIYAFANNPDEDKSTDTTGAEITDAAGRKVSVPENLDNGIVAIGSSGPLRFLSVFDVYDDIIEVDKGDVTDNRNGRAYSYAYDFKSFTADQYHDDNKLESETVEKIANKKPSLVVVQYSVYTSYKENCDTLAKACTLVVIPAQSMQTMWDSEFNLSADMVSTLTILGTVLNQMDRANEVIRGIEGIMDDLRGLVADTGKSVYVAGVTISGSNSLNTTFPVYMPFSLLDIDNAYVGGETASKVILKIEDLTKMDVDMIVVDPSSSDKLSTEDSQLVLQYFYGLNNDSDSSNDVPIYVTVPIVWDSINYDCALASAYCLANVVCGTLTENQVDEKIEHIFEVFYGDNGSDVLKDMKLFFVGKSSANNAEMPMLEKIEIVKNGDTYSFASA